MGDSEDGTSNRLFNPNWHVSSCSTHAGSKEEKII